MTASKSPTTVANNGSEPSLAAGTLGASSIAFFVIAAAAPLFVMAGVAPLAIGFGGIGAPSGYLIAGLSLAVFAVGFTAMSKYIRNAGAFYAYVARGLGPAAGIITAVQALMSYNALEIGMFGALGYFCHSTLATVVGISLPWWLWALAGALVVWFLGSRSIHVGAQFLVTLLTLETGVLVVLAIAVLIKGGSHGISFDTFTAAHTFTPQLGAVLAFAFAAFMGFESTALYREEAKQPERTIPIATYAAVVFLGVFYAFMTWIIVQAYGDDKVQEAANSDPGNLYFTAMNQYVGHWAEVVMELLILTSIVASLLAFHNAITRYAFALSKEGILPAQLGRLHPRHFSPYIASSWQTVLVVIVVAAFAIGRLDPMTQLLIWVNSPGVLGVILMQAIVAVAVISFFWKDRRGHSVLRVAVVPLLGALLLLGALALVVKNISLLTGAASFTDPVNVVVMAVVPLTAVVGILVAIRLKRTNPEIYWAVGTRDAD